MISTHADPRQIPKSTLSRSTCTNKRVSTNAFRQTPAASTHTHIQDPRFPGMSNNYRNPSSTQDHRRNLISRCYENASNSSAPPPPQRRRTKPGFPNNDIDNTEQIAWDNIPNAHDTIGADVGECWNCGAALPFHHNLECPNCRLPN